MAGPHVDVATARTAVRAALRDLGAGTPVLVACSGGADSLALAAATAFVAPRAGHPAGAVTVDHDLRAGSRAEARWAAEQCRARGLAPAVVVTAVVGPRGGPEGAAREARYAVLAEVAAARGAVVLLGHTMDDQAETVLLGLGRGSGARSLAGMPPETVRAAPDGTPVTFLRPFLGVRRTQTEGVCRALGLTFVHDPTNAAEGPWRAADGTALRRAAVRERVLPALADALGHGVVPALARTAGQLRRDQSFLDDAAAELLEAAAVTGGPTDLDVAVLAGGHPALRSRVLHRAARAAGAPGGDLTAGHVAALEALVTAFHGQGPVHLPGGVKARRRCGRLLLDRPR